MAVSSIFCGRCGTQNPTTDSFYFSCGHILSASATTAPPSPTLTGMLPAHTLLKQRYQVLQSVGKGGMGAVYRAEDTLLGNRVVAVKEMGQGNVSGQQAQEARENFKQEAHLLAGLHHPNLPSIHDYFEENERWYLVMSFIEDETLEEYLSRTHDQKLSLEETLRIGHELCNVLHYLHTHQPPIIFRDLKPSNIMRTADGHLYLIDFGIARHFKPGQAKDTASYGSAGYAPPEQYGREQTTERSDIYSLGATLYQLLSGYDPSQSPFRFPPLQSLVPTLPKRLVELITHMVEIDASKRPNNITVVEQELQQVSGPAATIDKTLKWSMPKAAMPKQQAPVLPSMPFMPVPPPASIAPTQYATATLVVPNLHTPSPSAPTQYTPPLAAYLPAQGPQISAQPQLGANASPTPAQHPAIKKASVLFEEFLSVIAMIIGAMFAAIGTIGILIAFSGDITSLAVGEFFLSFGLMTFFIARISKTPGKTESLIERLTGIAMILFASIIMIATISHPMDFGSGSDLSGIIACSVFAIIMGTVIWWLTRIRIKKTF